MCRFYVRAFDGTDVSEKDTYKTLMRTLETRFYKYEVQDETFAMTGVENTPEAESIAVPAVSTTAKELPTSAVEGVPAAANGQSSSVRRQRL
jgi:hypothetical protein